MTDRHQATMSFGEWLRDQLLARDWTAADLTKRSGMSSGRVSNLMNDRARIGAKGATQLAETLNLDVEVVYRAAGLIPDVNPPHDAVSRYRGEIYGLVNRINWTEERAQSILLQLRLFRQADSTAELLGDEPIDRGSPSPVSSDLPDRRPRD